MDNKIPNGSKNYKVHFQVIENAVLLSQIHKQCREEV